MLSGASTSKPLSLLESEIDFMTSRSSVIRVSAVGAMALTVTPYRPSSWLVMIVKAAMPALAAP